MVRLSAGLDSHNLLTDEASERALACLARFGQRHVDHENGHIDEPVLV